MWQAAAALKGEVNAVPEDQMRMQRCPVRDVSEARERKDGEAGAGSRTLDRIRQASAADWRPGRRHNAHCW